MNDQGREMMSLFEKEAHSFMIRLWRENKEQNNAQAEWRGWIDHIQSGQRHYFKDIAEIGRIVASYTSDLSGFGAVFEPIQGGEQ